MKPERDRGTEAVASSRTMPPAVATADVGFSSIVIVSPLALSASAAPQVIAEAEGP